ncbi:MAG: Fic family protein [Gemmatimonadales bacterium]
MAALVAIPCAKLLSRCTFSLDVNKTRLLVVKSGTPWPPIVYGGEPLSSRISRAVRRGELRKLGPALYTSNLADDPETVVARHRWDIVAHYAPGAVVSHRTAFEARAAADGTVFLTGPIGKRLDIPGLRLRVAKGPGPLPGDHPFLEGLMMASESRLLLENLSLSRGRGGTRRTVSREAVEQRLEAILRARGESALNRLRDDARGLALLLGAAREQKALDGIIGALLRSRPAGNLRTATGTAHAAGAAFDPERAERFDLLARSLTTVVPISRPDPVLEGPAFANLAFFDAYFSNFIEGTEFEIAEARAIVFEGAIPARRPADADDVLGTWRLVGDPTWLAQSTTIPAAPAFLRSLKDAHATLLAGRPEAGPGEWKTLPNQAGGTRFVEPELVQGTLAQGWQRVISLREPLPRAAMLMFVITEVHPFTDGNGRLARAFMNAQLVSARERRIVIPTVFREDYLGALRALSRQDDPRPFVLMLDQAQRFTHAITWYAYDEAVAQLEAAQAFARPEAGVRLRVPRTAV